MIVRHNGSVSRVFECASVDGPISVTLANGDAWANGVIVRTKPGTFREPADLRIKTRWRVVGQFLYFDDNWKRVASR